MMREAHGVCFRRTTAVTTRTISSIVAFAHPFRLAGFDAAQPAGDYLVNHDEEAIEVISHTAWRRIASFIHLPAVGMRASVRQMVPIEAAELEAALNKDHQQS
jgi:hypothetical protein